MTEELCGFAWREYDEKLQRFVTRTCDRPKGHPTAFTEPGAGAHEYGTTMSEAGLAAAWEPGDHPRDYGLTAEPIEGTTTRQDWQK